METVKKKHKYIEWISPEEMHEASKQWLSELNFVRDEQWFLNDLVKSYTLQLVDAEVFEESKSIIDSLLQAEKEVVSLMKKVQSHENQLDIMVDDVDQPKMEKAYKASHRELLTSMELYLAEYRSLKEKLFKLVSKVMKKGKQKRLLS